MLVETQSGRAAVKSGLDDDDDDVFVVIIKTRTTLWSADFREGTFSPEDCADSAPCTRRRAVVQHTTRCIREIGVYDFNTLATRTHAYGRGKRASFYHFKLTVVRTVRLIFRGGGVHHPRQPPPPPTPRRPFSRCLYNKINAHVCKITYTYDVRARVFSFSRFAAVSPFTTLSDYPFRLPFPGVLDL